MIGLIYLLAAVVYLLVSVLAVVLAVKAARRRGRAGWKWGLAAGLGMYLLVFWDWIPTLAAHKYYCARYAGFTEYKSVDEWKAENPGVAETLSSSPTNDWLREKDHIIYRLNQRFVWKVLREPVLFGKKTDKKIIDEQTEAVLAEYVDFDTDIKAVGLGARSLRDLKVWLKRDSCMFPGEKRELISFNKLMQDFENLGDGAHGSGKDVPNGATGGS